MEPTIVDEKPVGGIDFFFFFFSFVKWCRRFLRESYIIVCVSFVIDSDQSVKPLGAKTLQVGGSCVVSGVVYLMYWSVTGQRYLN